MKRRHNLLRGLLALYKQTLSPVLAWLGGGGCRFTPTCSEYCVEAMEKHGWLRGFWLGLCRIGRCNPWGGCGHDPVPEVSPSSPSPAQTPPNPHKGCPSCNHLTTH